MFKDKIGSASFVSSSGLLTVQPSVVTLGGVQLVTPTLSFDTSSLTSFTPYFLWVYYSNGAFSLGVSSDEAGTELAAYKMKRIIGYFRTNDSNAGIMSGAICDEFSGRPSVLMASFTGSYFHTSSGSYQTIVWNYAYQDDLCVLDKTTGIATIKDAGEYASSAQVYWYANTTGIRLITYDITIGGASTLHNARTSPMSYSSSMASQTHFEAVKFDAGDTIKINAYQSSGGSLAFYTGRVYSSFSLTKVNYGGNQQLERSILIS